MKNLLFCFIVLTFLLISCTKTNTQSNCISSDKPHINCDGLITDTLGKNDSAGLIIPNAFTPNNDDIDDGFEVQAYHVTSLSITIYDDDNNIVFNTTTHERWLPSAISSSKEYFYKVQATTNQGNHIGRCGNLYALTCFPSCLNKDSLYFADFVDPITDCH